MINIGDWVRVTPRHWLRGNERGQVIAIEKERYEIEFETEKGGRTLWLEERDFAVEK